MTRHSSEPPWLNDALATSRLSLAAIQRVRFWSFGPFSSGQICGRYRLCDAFFLARFILFAATAWKLVEPKGTLLCLCLDMESFDHQNYSACMKACNQVCRVLGTRL